MIKLLLAILLLAQPLPPYPLGSTLDPVDGVAPIAYENSGGADTVIAVLDRADCRIPTLAAIADPSDPQAVVQVPFGPPYDARCLLRPGDHVHLLRYRQGQLVGEDGPYIVPVKVWLPRI